MLIETTPDGRIALSTLAEEWVVFPQERQTDVYPTISSAAKAIVDGLLQQRVDAVER